MNPFVIININIYLLLISIYLFIYFYRTLRIVILYFTTKRRNL